jgi:hypothetical protein
MRTHSDQPEGVTGLAGLLLNREPARDARPVGNDQAEAVSRAR